MKTLIVDDDQNCRDLIKRTFEKFLGIEVEEATSGAATPRILNGSFDLVMMDNNMPGIKGYDVVRMLRQHGYTGEVWGYTGAAFTEEVNRFVSAGLDECFIKPVNLDDIINMVTEKFDIKPV